MNKKVIVHVAQPDRTKRWVLESGREGTARKPGENKSYHVFHQLLSGLFTLVRKKKRE